MSVKTALEELKYNIDNLNLYRNPWTRVYDDGVDPLGSFTLRINMNDFKYNYDPDIIYSNLSAYKYYGGYYRLSDEIIARTDGYIDGILFPNCKGPETVSTSLDGLRMTGLCHHMAIDMSNAEMLGYIPFLVSNGLVRRLLFPRTCALSSNLVVSGSALFGIYLPQYTISNSSNWLIGYTTGSASSVDQDPTCHTKVRCPKNSNVEYYLQNVVMNAESMVSIFNNLIDNSSSTRTKKITLGSYNLARLTEEQKNIAYSKGWTLA